MKKVKENSEFIINANNSLGQILQELENVESVELGKLENNNTALIIIDMVRGFVDEGLLQSPRAAALVPEIARILQKCSEKELPIVFLADTHMEESPEFEAFPPHCIKGSSQCDEANILKNIGRYTLMRKNSTNGFLEPEFQSWLMARKHITTFIVVGVCTDICILQFSLSLKAELNRINEHSRIIVPMNAVDTFASISHDADLMNVFALYNMRLNGIEVVKKVKC